MTNEAEVFAARQASRRHQEWVERETVLGAKRYRLETSEIEFAPRSDCWGFEVTPATGVVL